MFALDRTQRWRDSLRNKRVTNGGRVAATYTYINHPTEEPAVRITPIVHPPKTVAFTFYLNTFP